MISVIVPVRNGMPWLEEQLRAVIDQACDMPWEMIVADNGSTDGSAELVEKFVSRNIPVRTVDASAVRGPGATRNLGARVANGELLAFCDADDVVWPGWLQGCVDALSEADGAGGVTDFWSLNDISAPEPPIPNTPPAGRQFGFLEAGLSSNLAVKRSVFETLGGFEESMFTGEDTDFCWRLQTSGYEFVISREMVVSRRDRSGVGQVFRRFVAYGRSGPVLFKRHKKDGLKREGTNALRAWAWLLVSVPKLMKPDFRVRWVSVAGWRWGRITESVKQGVFFP